MLTELKTSKTEEINNRSCEGGAEAAAAYRAKIYRDKKVGGLIGKVIALSTPFDYMADAKKRGKAVKRLAQYARNPQSYGDDIARIIAPSMKYVYRNGLGRDFKPLLENVR
jgi:hypothetical protein